MTRPISLVIIEQLVERLIPAARREAMAVRDGVIHGRYLLLPIGSLIGFLIRVSVAADLGVIAPLRPSRRKYKLE